MTSLSIANEKKKVGIALPQPPFPPPLTRDNESFFPRVGGEGRFFDFFEISQYSRICISSLKIRETGGSFLGKCKRGFFPAMSS